MVTDDVEEEKLPRQAYEISVDCLQGFTGDLDVRPASSDLQDYPQPLVSFTPDLQRQPWWDLDDTLEKLQGAAADIALEIPRLDPQDFDALSEGSQACFFVEEGVWDDAACARCPAVGSLLRSLPICQSSVGHAYLLVMAPNTTLSLAHQDSNFKLTLHLPLPAEGGEAAAACCRVVVGGEARVHEAGRALAFDPSFPHSMTSSGGASPCVTLVVDIWHPGLSERSVARLRGAFDPSSTSPSFRLDMYQDPPKVNRDAMLLLKLLPIGDSGVGKTCFVNRLKSKAFTSASKLTVGVDYSVRFFRWREREYKLQLWDVAGSERFAAMRASYYRGAHGVFLLFDCTDRRSFESVRDHWYAEAQRRANNGGGGECLVLVATKTDVDAACRQVSREEGVALAASLRLPYVEVSAKTGDGIQRAFAVMLKLIHRTGRREIKTAASNEPMPPTPPPPLPRNRSTSGTGSLNAACCLM